MKVLMQTRTEIERGGSLIPVDAIGVISYKTDNRYGEDADGNRGEKWTIVDEVLDIHVWDDDVHELNLSNKEEERIADTLIYKFFNN